MKAVASSASVHSLYVKHSSKEIVISNSSIHKSVSDVWIAWTWIHLSHLDLIWDLETLNWTISTHRSIWDLRGTVLHQTQKYYWAHVGASVFRLGFYLLTWPRSPESMPASEIYYLMFVRQLFAAACSCLSTVEALSGRLNAKVRLIFI